jgi:hypothetical protein
MGSDKVECTDCPISMLCFAGRLGRTWNEEQLHEYCIDQGDGTHKDDAGILNVDCFHACVCPQCGIMTAYPSATGLEVGVTFECCMRPLNEVQDVFRTQSRYSGSTLNRLQKNKGAFYINPETGLEHQVWFLMDDPGPGDVIVAMLCGECKKSFEEKVEKLARRVALLRENVDVNNHINVRLGPPRELQREVKKLSNSIGGEFVDVEGEIYVRERDPDTGAPIEPLSEWDEEGEGFEG